jgi:hypothetical protein
MPRFCTVIVRKSIIELILYQCAGNALLAVEVIERMYAMHACMHT